MPYACPIQQRAAHNEAVKRWRQKSAKRYAAQQAVKKALANGSLIRWPGCAACHRKRGLEAHHYDYDRPLDVSWLCMKCHKAAHAIVGFRNTDHTHQPTPGHTSRSGFAVTRTLHIGIGEAPRAHLSRLRMKLGDHPVEVEI